MNSINLRKEMEQIIDKYGHYVLLQRTSRKIRCICWNEKYHESDVRRYIELTKYKGGALLKSCPRCLGLGWVSRMERHKIRRDNSSQVISLPNLIQQTAIGQIGSDARVFYFKHDVHPKEGDIIYEVGWSGKKPTHIQQMYRINSSEDLRGDSGRIEWYSAVCREDNITTDIRAIVIRHLGPVENYEIVKGEKNRV